MRRSVIIFLSLGTLQFQTAVSLLKLPRKTKEIGTFLVDRDTVLVTHTTDSNSIFVSQSKILTRFIFILHIAVNELVKQLNQFLLEFLIELFWKLIREKALCLQYFASVFLVISSSLIDIFVFSIIIFFSFLSVFLFPFETTIIQQ